MDASLKAILGISEPNGYPAPRRLIPPVVDPKKRGEINQAYKGLGLPPIFSSDNPMVQDFHTRALDAIYEETRGAVEAINKIREDGGLNHDTRLGRMVGVARMSTLALQTRLRNLAVPLARVIQDARAIIDKAMNRQPSEPNAAVLWFLKVADTRRQLEALTSEEALKAAFTLAERGDEVWPAVFLDSLKPLPEDMAVRLTEMYQKAAAGDQVEILTRAKEALEEVQAVIGCAELALGVTVGNLGISQEWKKFPTTDIVRAWPKATSAAFIAAKGSEAYTSLLQGRMGLETALGLFRPGLEEV